jgi:hypothetical protein
MKKPSEKIDISLCKYILGVTKQSTNSAVRGKLGRYPLAIDSIMSALKFYKHLKDGSSKNCLLDNAIRESTNIDKANVFSWFTYKENG